jgi:hypothetical protein
MEGMNSGTFFVESTGIGGNKILLQNGNCSKRKEFSTPDLSMVVKA